MTIYTDLAILHITIKYIFLCLFFFGFVSCKPKKNTPSDNQANDSTLISSSLIKNCKDPTNKFLGLDSLVPGTEKQELRLNIRGYPWLGGEMMIINFKDTIVTLYRYKIPEDDMANKYIYTKQNINPKIPWKYFIDSLDRFKLFALRDQLISDSLSTIDGQTYTIEFSKDNHFIKVCYSNPSIYHDEGNVKVVEFLNFINKSVIPIFHTVIDEKSTIN